MDKFDLVVIGGGSGGVRAARMASQRGMRVAIVEDTHWGGTCVNVGCVPKKLMVYASHFSHEFEDAREYGWEVAAGKFNWSHFIERKNTEIERLNGIYVRLLESAGVQVINGRGVVECPGQVRVETSEGHLTLQAEKILLAVGGKPFVPDIPGAELAISSDQVFYLPEQPEKVVIVGGGFIALEFACILAGMGSKVTLLYRRDLFLRGFDRDLRERMVDAVRRSGVEVKFNTDVESIQPGDDETRLVNTSTGEQLQASQVFFATGRIPRTDGLFGSGVNVELAKGGEVIVDDNFETSVPGIFALGDVVGRLALTPVALAEAMALLDYWFDGKAVNINYELIPSAVFTQPNLSTVGLTEEQAVSRNIPFKVFEADFKHMKYSLTSREDRVYLKMLVHAETDKVLGVHAIGPDVGEMIQTAAVAMQAGATKADFDRTVGIHPTMAEELVTMRTPRDARS